MITLNKRIIVTPLGETIYRNVVSRDKVTFWARWNNQYYQVHGRVECGNLPHYTKCNWDMVGGPYQKPGSVAKADWRYLGV